MRRRYEKAGVRKRAGRERERDVERREPGQQWDLNTNRARSFEAAVKAATT